MPTEKEWISTEDAGVLAARSARTIQRWIKDGHIEGRKEKLKGSTSRWLVEQGSLEHYLARLDEGLDDNDDVVEVSDDSPQGRYTIKFDEDTRRHFVYIRGDEAPVIVPDHDKRNMIRDYSKQNGSKGMTIQKMAYKYKLTYKQAWNVIKAFGWTHDTEPFTEEEVLELDEEELAADWITQKRAAVHQRVMAAEQKEIEKKARKYDEVDYNIGSAFRRAIEDLTEEGKIFEMLPPIMEGAQTRRYAAVYAPTDLHFGKYGWSGFGPGAYNRKICEERLVTATDKLLNDMLLYGNPEKIIFPIGGDWFHIDNAHGGTTRGTPQDMDGVPEEIVLGGVDLALRMARRIRQVAPVEFLLWGGNHDWVLSVLLARTIQAYFDGAGDEFATFSPTATAASPYQWSTYGKNLLGFHHGDGVKAGLKLSALMSHHNPEAWGETDHRYMFTGNLHHFSAQEDGGITTFICPSLSGADRWHVRKGYTMSKPAMDMYLLDHDEGKFAILSQMFRK